MGGRTVKLCVLEEAYATIEATAQRTGRSVSDIATEMLDEAARLRRVPGIVFAHSTNGRVARIAGTGLEGWNRLGAGGSLKLTDCLPSGTAYERGSSTAKRCDAG